MDSKAAAIILAGGSGTRFGRGLNKVYRDLDGRAVLRWSLDVLAPIVGTVVVVARPEDRDLLDPIIRDFEVIVADGGLSRTDSERSGLEALRNQIAAGLIDVVAIHDGARPFVTAELVEELILATRRVGGAIPGWQVEDGTSASDASAVYELDGYGRVTVQTPQAFRAAELLHAFDASPTAQAADTAQLVGAHGDLDIALVDGPRPNRKITFPDDL